MNKTFLTNLNEDYYERKYIIYEILKECKNRDFSMLDNKENKANIRGLNIRCIFDFKRALKWTNWKKYKQNMYVSCAKLNSIPIFTFNPKKRNSETQRWYSKEYNKHIVSYDLFFDFDKKEDDSWKKLLQEVYMFKEYLDDYNIPYYVVFSGNKGFQIIINGEYLSIEKIERGNIYPHKEIVENIKEMLKLNFLDLANNGVNSRLRKLPYSLVGNNIALPLDDNQLENFKIEDMKINNVMKNIKIIRRGNLERFSNLSLENKKKNIEKFIKIFKFKKIGG